MNRRLKGEGTILVWGYFLLVFLFCFSSCGLPDNETFLYPPDNATISGTSFEFKHNIENNDAGFFQGYEIFYRLYEKSEQANRDAAAIESGLYETVATTGSLVFKERLRLFMYKRLVNIDAVKGTQDVRTIKPLLVINSEILDSEPYITIYFSALTKSTIIVKEGPYASLSVRRNNDEADIDFKSFSDLTKDSNDEDCFYSEGTHNPQTAYLKAYILAYGSDFTSIPFTEIVSKPLSVPLITLISE